MNNNVLYITYDGLTDPLGQSQIIPYLTGLSGQGFPITVISCEKRKNFFTEKKKIEKKLLENGVKWHPLFYTKKPLVISTLFDLLKIWIRAISLHKQESSFTAIVSVLFPFLNRENGSGFFAIVHCRSYIGSLIGLNFKKRFNTKFIFDMRGFWADERVEGNIWKMKNPLYKIVFNFFKKKETEFFGHADHTISLTEKAKTIIHSFENIPNQPIPISVIPCCVDLKLFSPDNIDKSELLKLKKEIKITDDDFVLSYVGSTGTWYMVDKMLLFFKCLLLIKPESKFLFITHEWPGGIFKVAIKYGISTDRIIVQKAARSEVPLFLSLSKASIFFIRPTFSKNASCPTKMGEIMAMGIPFVSNNNVGDIDSIIRKTNSGILISEFSEMEFKKIAEKLDSLISKDKTQVLKGAHDFFSLEKGVAIYGRVYRSLLN